MKLALLTLTLLSVFLCDHTWAGPHFQRLQIRKATQGCIGLLRKRDDFRQAANYAKTVSRLPILERDEFLKLVEQYKTHHDLVAQKKIITSYLRIVPGIVFPLARKCPEILLMDLIQQGNEGLLHALDHFNVSVSENFYGYAKLWVYGEIQDLIFQNRGEGINFESASSEVYLFSNYNKLIKKLEQQGKPLTAANIANLANEDRQFGSKTKKPVITEEDVQYYQEELSVRKKYTAMMKKPSVDLDAERSLAKIVEGGETQPSDEDRAIELEKLQAFQKRILQFEKTLTLPGDVAIFRGRFWTDDEDQLSLQDIGKTMGITRQAVHPREKKIRSKSRSFFEKYNSP